MKKTLVYGQSGGPSPVINASAYGVIKEALKYDNEITNILLMHHGIQGVLTDDFIHVTDILDQIELLKFTPGSAFGSVRHKLADFRKDDTEYKRIVEVFKKYNVRYFFYNGGNDSMDTCNKVNEYLQHINYDCKVIGIPKTIDNDLPYTDHTPGFGSAAKFIANTVANIKLDSTVYPKGKVTIVEVMGRHAGWLAASAHLAHDSNLGPDLVYLPEMIFDMDEFVQKVHSIYKEKKHCLIVVSEGIKNKEGKFISGLNRMTDAFGHVQLGGVALYLGDVLEQELHIPYRAIELSTIQRSAGYHRSKVDVEEAVEVGRQAVRFALLGETGKMVTLKRIMNHVTYYGVHDVSQIANQEKVIPATMIIDESEMSDEWYNYMRPLVQGEEVIPTKDGIVQCFTITK